MKFRKNYVRPETQPTINNEPSMTQPEHESDLEINSVMARYVATGYLPVKEAAAQFADLSDIMDFDKAQDKILKARSLFLDLPIEVKDEFRTADELLKAFHSDRGRKKLREHGLIVGQEDAKNPPVASGSAAVLSTPPTEGSAS